MFSGKTVIFITAPGSNSKNEKKNEEIVVKAVLPSK